MDLLKEEFAVGFKLIPDGSQLIKRARGSETLLALWAARADLSSHGLARVLEKRSRSPTSSATLTSLALLLLSLV